MTGKSRIARYWSNGAKPFVIIVLLKGAAVKLIFCFKKEKVHITKITQKIFWRFPWQAKFLSKSDLFGSSTYNLFSLKYIEPPTFLGGHLAIMVNF